MYYIATFFSHFGAVRFKRECQREGISAQLMPVPRSLSSSCGTCVRFWGPEDYEGKQACGELEQIVRETEQGYEVIYDGE